jgi:hypothetical protein
VEAGVVAAEIYVYSRLPLGRPRGDLEDDLDEALGGIVTVTGGGGGLRGWHIDLEIAADESIELEAAVGQVVAFLCQWGVPPDTFLHVYPHDWREGQPPQRVTIDP